MQQPRDRVVGSMNHQLTMKIVRMALHRIEKILRIRDKCAGNPFRWLIIPQNGIHNDNKIQFHASHIGSTHSKQHPPTLIKWPARARPTSATRCCRPAPPLQPHAGIKFPIQAHSINTYGKIVCVWCNMRFDCRPNSICLHLFCSIVPPKNRIKDSNCEIEPHLLHETFQNKRYNHYWGFHWHNCDTYSYIFVLRRAYNTSIPALFRI